MKFSIGLIVCMALAVTLILSFVIFKRKRRKKLMDQEQMGRKAREDILDRALSNQLHRTVQHASQTPLETHYNSEQKVAKGTKMIRLTELSESVTREYLFQWEDTVFLGKEYGRAAVFHQRDNHQVYCKIFPLGGYIYVSQQGSEKGYLVRGKKRADLEPSGLRVLSGDKLEIALGTFLIEFI